MRKTFVIILALATCVSSENFANKPKISLPLKSFKTTKERISEHGYPVESHYVETPDGYVINVFQIPYSSKLNNVKTRKPVVLLLHGLMSSSDCFILNGPDNAIAFNFVDAGFDVWLSNARGNIYSRNNTKISANHPYFWRFSWHEIGAIDLPATIDYILAKTGEASLHYVGHSQGTTAFAVMASFVPDYNVKIKTAHLLAPAVFIGNATDSLIVSLSPTFGIPGLAATLVENQEILPHNTLAQRVLDTACSEATMFSPFCSKLFYSTAETENKFNRTMLPLVAETHPAGLSSNQGIHYFQSFISNEFRRYNYGIVKNRKIYNQDMPPSYQLTKITADTYLYIGLSDQNAPIEDAYRLLDYLPNIKLFHVVEDPSWSHFDFLLAFNVKETINNKVIGNCLDYEASQQT